MQRFKSVLEPLPEPFWRGPHGRVLFRDMETLKTVQVGDTVYTWWPYGDNLFTPRKVLEVLPDSAGSGLGFRLTPLPEDQEDHKCLDGPWIIPEDYIYRLTVLPPESLRGSEPRYED